MASHQASRDKPRAAKCNHFCHPFDTHNFCPTCREAGKGDDPCVTLVSSCTICSSFTEEQITKISHNKRYSKKSNKKEKAEDTGSELLGDNSIESFGGSQAELEMAADRLFTSPPLPQPLSFEALSSRTPARTVPTTPGTTLQLKVQANLEKSLSSHINIQMDQKMGAFQASMLEAFNNLREDFLKNLYKSQERWIRPLLLLLQKRTHPPKIWTNPRKPVVLSSLWRWSMAQIFRLASTLIPVASKTTRVKFVIVPRIPRRLPRPNINKQHTLLGMMLWILALPRTTTLTILLTLNQPLVGPKSTLISQNTSRGPDFYPHLQRRISPLNIGIGPPSPPGSLTLIRTTPNMTLTLLITGK